MTFCHVLLSFTESLGLKAATPRLFATQQLYVLIIKELFYFLNGIIYASSFIFTDFMVKSVKSYS